MLKVYKDSVVYVVCPSFNKTGGTELAHQLVREINKNGGKSVIAYYDMHNKPLKINDAFKEYVSSFVDVNDVEDSERNILVVPEVDPEFIGKFKSIQKCIWWMSVDNYLKNRNAKFARKYFGFLSMIKGLLTGKLKISLPRFEKGITHFYQSAYARNFLEKCGENEIVHLSDYINKTYLESMEKLTRLDRVLYNPRKGIEFTRRLISASPELLWVPIENMTTEEVRRLLQTSKVYVDFGNHPGKDRFPREAAMCGCCVLTGKSGSAAFFEDVSINEDFKYDESTAKVEEIINKIKQCLSSFDEESKKFDYYRDCIRAEPQLFSLDVKEIFINSICE